MAIPRLPPYHLLMPPPITPGWKFHHIGLEGDPVLQDGVDLWKSASEWESLKTKIVTAHPSYPEQRHDLKVYRLKDRNLTFAAGEVSNGVWVFCIPL